MERRMNNELTTDYKTLAELSVNALKNLVIDIRAQVSAGLMSNKEAHDRINKISAVIMMKEIDEMVEAQNA